VPRYYLRLRNTEINLPAGEVIIGRGPDCIVRIDDPVISRRHARLLVHEDAVWLEDLGSRNGCFLNGVRLDGRRPMAVGDRILIGQEELVLLSTPTGIVEEEVRTTSAISIVRCPHCDRMVPSVLDTCPSCGGPVADKPAAAKDEDTTAEAAIHLLSGVGEKALAKGRIDEAERLLGGSLANLLKMVRGGKPLGPEITEEAMRRALRLAAATRKAFWFAWVFEFAGALAAVLPSVIIDELHQLMFQHKPEVAAAVDGYLARLAARGIALDDEAQQRLRRIAQLRRFCREAQL
jgi:hypothetical protein